MRPWVKFEERSGSAGTEGHEGLPFMEQNQGRKAVQTKRQGMISPPFTHTHTHKFGNMSWL